MLYNFCKVNVSFDILFLEEVGHTSEEFGSENSKHLYYTNIYSIEMKNKSKITQRIKVKT